MSPNLKVRDVIVDIRSILDMQGVVEADRASMLSAGVLFIPNEYRDSPHAFASGTSDFYDYCKSQMPDMVEICTTDEGYLEIELNSCSLRINKTKVKGIVFTVFLGVLSNYIADWSKTYVMPQETKVESLAPPTVSFSVVVEDVEKGVCKQFDYEGPVEEAPAIIDEIKLLWNGEENQRNK